METVIQLNSEAKLSPHFTLGELTKTSHKVYNIPSHEAIENLKRLCPWLEYLRKRYNELNQTTPNPSSLFEEGRSQAHDVSHCLMQKILKIFRKCLVVTNFICTFASL